MSKTRSKLSTFEFVALMASMMSLVALSIDAVLPALPEIQSDLNVFNEKSIQLVVSILFLGLSLGQLVFGTLSDFFGRKPVVGLGILLFVIGSWISFSSSSLTGMLMGRFIQGVGLSSPKTISIAIVRDQFSGSSMAKIMSFIMSIFILIPVIAPLLGQTLLTYFSWQYIFISTTLYSLIILVWFYIRQPETLDKDKQKSFSSKLLFKLIASVITNRQSIGYTVVAGVVAGMFLGFLSSIQPVFEMYDRHQDFAKGFAILALFIGCSHIINTKIVNYFKINHIVVFSLVTISIISSVFLVYNEFFMLGFGGIITLFAIIIFCIGVLFGNLNALAMTPLGESAGIGSSIVGSLSTFISVPIGISIGYFLGPNKRYIICSYLVYSIFALAITIWTEKKANKVKH